MPLEHWLNRSFYRTAHHRYGSDLDPHSFDYGELGDGSILFTAQLMDRDGSLADVELRVLSGEDFPEIGGVPSCLTLNGELRNYFDPLNYRILTPYQELGRWYEYILDADAFNRLALKREGIIDGHRLGGSSIQAQIDRIEHSLAHFGGGSTNVANFSNAAELASWFDEGNEGALRIEVYPLKQPLALHRTEDGDHVHFERIVQRSGEQPETEYLSHVLSPAIHDVSDWDDIGNPPPPLCAIDVMSEGRELTEASVQWGIGRDFIEPNLGDEKSHEWCEWYAITIEKCPGFIIVPRTGATIVLSWDLDGAQISIIAESESVTSAKNRLVRRHHREWAHWIDEFNSLSQKEIDDKVTEVEARLRRLAQEQNCGR